MSYGSPDPETLAYLQSRINDSGLSARLDHDIILEPCMYVQHNGADVDYPNVTVYCTKPRDHTEVRTHWVNRHQFEPLMFLPTLFQITVVVDGALDEEFVIKSAGYEVNIADWLAEHLCNQYDDGESWKIIVSPYNDDSTRPMEAVYTVTDEDSI